jgi:hypothetical protein
VSDNAPTATMEMAAVAGLAVGLIFVGSAHEVHAAVLAGACKTTQGGAAA